MVYIQLCDQKHARDYPMRMSANLALRYIYVSIALPSSFSSPANAATNRHQHTRKWSLARVSFVIVKFIKLRLQENKIVTIGSADIRDMAQKYCPAV